MRFHEMRNLTSLRSCLKNRSRLNGLMRSLRWQFKSLRIRGPEDPFFSASARFWFVALEALLEAFVRAGALAIGLSWPKTVTRPFVLPFRSYTSCIRCLLELRVNHPTPRGFGLSTFSRLPESEFRRASWGARMRPDQKI